MVGFNIEQHPHHSYCGDDDSDIKVFFVESPQFSNAGERSIADDGGGHIGTKNPVLNYWNKIYRGSDFVFGSTIGEIGEVGEHNASIRGASEA